MSYMVIFRTPDGKPGYQQADDPGDIVATVERLRNEDGVENVRIYRMEEVEFEYKVRYTVELKDPSLAAAGAPDAAPAPAPAAPTDALSWDDDEDAAPDGGDAGEGGAPSQPFDQMAAIDTTEPPRWGEPGAGEAVEDDESDPTGARRGLFGR